MHPDQRRAIPPCPLARLIWSRWTRWMEQCRCRIEVVGRDHLPRRPGFVMIADHAGSREVPILASALPARWSGHVSAIATGDGFFGKPSLAGFAAPVVTALPFWLRKRHAPWSPVQSLRDELAREPMICIVLPGSDSGRGSSELPDLGGLGALVAGTNIPVVPCHIETGSANPHSSPGWGVRRAVSLRIGEALAFPGVANGCEGWNQVSDQTRAAVASLQAH